MTSTLFITVITMVAASCMQKLEMPRLHILRHRSQRSRKHSFVRVRERNLLRYTSVIPQETTYPRTVAMAAPVTPIWNTKIKMGSRIVFKIAPLNVAIMAKTGLPSARRMELKPILNI